MVVYLDFYFIIHFFVNLFCVFFTVSFRKKQVRIPRMIGISFIGAILSCIIVIHRFGIPLPVWVLLQIMSLVFFSTSWEGIKEFVKSLAVFLGVVCVTAGGCTFLFRIKELIFGGKKIETLYMMLISGMLLGVVFLYGIKVLYRKKYLQKNTMLVSLIHGKKKCQVKALLDSGNLLVSPYTGEKIAVISQKTADALELEKEQHPLLVPFSTIGGGGMMSVYRLEKMIDEKQREKKELLVAVNESLDSHREIQMILNI